jgi:dipeptide transport system substrate-binding protein
MGGDPEARLSVYHEAQELFQRDMPWVPLYHVSVFTAYRRVVRGLSVGPTGILRYDKTWKKE